MNSAGKQFAQSFMEFFVFLSKFFVDRPVPSNTSDLIQFFF